MRAFITDDQYRMLIDMLGSSCERIDKGSSVVYRIRNNGISEITSDPNTEGQIECKWVKEWYCFNWEGTDIRLEFIKAYGYVLTVTGNNAQEKMDMLGIEPSPDELFQKVDDWYERNWKDALSMKSTI